MDPELPQRRVVEKEGAQGGVVTSLDHLPGAALLALRHGLPSTGTVQGKPPSAGLKPLPDDLVLLLVWVGAGDVRDQESAGGQPLGDVRKIVGDGREHARALVQQLEDPQASVVHIVPGGRTGGESPGNDVYSDGLRLTHLIATPPVLIRCKSLLPPHPPFRLKQLYDALCCLR